MHNLAASWHLYPNSYCNTQSCWDTQFQPFLSRAAAVATEIGQGPSSPAPCGVDFLDNVMLWLDAHNAGYLAWTWDAWGDCFSLIGNWGDASPPYAPTTPYGRTYHDHLLGIPQPPTSVVAAAGSGTVAVSWQPPVDQGTSPISGYQVIPHDVSAGTDGAAVTVTGTTANVSVVNGRSYTFTVTATNDAGTGAPSAASAAVTPQAGLPVPAAATGTSSPATSSTVSTGSDPGTTGGTATQITVPAGTGGGTITVTQRGTTESSPTGYTFGGVQIDISAPPATQANPLTLVFTTALPSGYPAPPDPSALNATDVYRAEGTGSPQAIPACNGSVVDPEPACVAGKQYVTLNASTYVQVTVLAETASHWNSARPSSTAVRVSNSGYSPAAATVQQGGLITWAFAGKKQDSVTESVGLGPAGKPLFDSGAKSTGSYAFQFVAAGTYAYKSTVKGDSFTGSAAVAPAISHPGSSYVVIWAAGRMTGYVFDVQYRFKPKGSTKWGSWTAWQKGTANDRRHLHAAEGRRHVQLQGLAAERSDRQVLRRFAGSAVDASLSGFAVGDRRVVGLIALGHDLGLDFGRLLLRCRGCGAGDAVDQLANERDKLGARIGEETVGVVFVRAKCIENFVDQAIGADARLADDLGCVGARFGANLVADVDELLALDLDFALALGDLRLGLGAEAVDFALLLLDLGFRVRAKIERDALGRDERVGDRVRPVAVLLDVALQVADLARRGRPARGRGPRCARRALPAARPCSRGHSRGSRPGGRAERQNAWPRFHHRPKPFGEQSPVRVAWSQRSRSANGSRSWAWSPISPDSNAFLTSRAS